MLAACMQFWIICMVEPGTAASAAVVAGMVVVASGGLEPDVHP
jgi:hypothetical protein